MSKEYIIINCPHCYEPVIIYKNQIKCGIFRHAVYKKTNKPINSHLSQNKCESLIKSKKIFGCGKPFRLNNQNSPEICDYL
jgi:hypothetical protein